jgi:rhodanese-related sulfurtransferase
MKHSPKFERLVKEIKSYISEISIEKVLKNQKRNEPPHLIDVREDHEWVKGHLPKAFHLGRGIIERDIERLFPDCETQIILYCGGGYRSALAAHNLQKMGYKNVMSMEGGFRGWCEKGLPIAHD